MNKIPIYNIVLGNADGIQIMSLVDCPAVEVDFLKFNKEEQKLNFSIANEEEQIVFGCALRADYPIYRYNERIGEYYVVFSRETIKELYQKFMIEGLSNNVNLNHDKMIDGACLIESFIKDTENGISPNGFENCADGSWFCSYKILNGELWDSIKKGEFNGFSVEGFFELEPLQLKKEEKVNEFDELIDNITK